MTASQALKKPTGDMHSGGNRHASDADGAFSRGTKDKTTYSQFQDTVALIEKAHRVLLDTVKDELARLRISDLNATQAVMIYKIGEKSVPVGELTGGWIYNGTNPSYNLKQLKEAGYVESARCNRDMRIVRVRLTEKAKSTSRVISELFERQSEQFMKRSSSSVDDIIGTVEALHCLERQLLASLERAYRFIRS
jgi:DNA-binding MarR family transcriptional regulator